MTEEYGSLDLHKKIIDIICEEWPKNPDNELEITTIHERLRSEGVEISDHALRAVLLQLSDHGNINTRGRLDSAP